ncbi:hypothetical protein Bolokhovo_60 [Bacillus phage Bolokhovo]|uniref:Uncharacterized protein n=1 Tax=Bacillus phage Bolokhovo TaxID=2743970 RepID=A0A7D7PB82_9CAUD|nr:hypothetical protein Bolokhovo_60 [Bacillus phage Bolokhovo]
MNKTRTIVLPSKQGETLEHLIERFSELTNDPVQKREKMADFVISNYGDWEGAFKPLNKVPFNDLLYIVTGGAWEIQKSVKSVLKEMIDGFECNGMIRQTEAIEAAITRLEKEGLI